MSAGLSTDQVLAFVLLDVAVIVVAARGAAAVAVRLGQPKVVGEIIAGVLLGPTLLGATVFTWGGAPDFLHCDEALAATAELPSISSCLFPPQARSVLGMIGQLALLLYMLLVGMELDVALLRGRLRSIAIVAVAAVCVPVVLGFAITPALFSDEFAVAAGTPEEPSRLAFALLVGGMLAVTAFPVMARILQEKRLVATDMGAVGIAAAAVVSVLMFLVLGAGGSVARSDGVSSVVARLAGAAAYIAAMIWVVRPLLQRRLGAAYDRRRHLTPEMLAGVVTVGVLSAYAAHQIGVNVIVGGFIAGVVMPAPRTELHHAVDARLGDVTTAVLLPVFLAFSGLNTDFTQLGTGHVLGVALFVVTGIVAKWGAAAVAARASGLNWAEGNVLGVLMNCRGLLVLVAALVARDTGVITGPMQVGAVLMALITTIMTGPLLDRLLPKVATSRNERASALAPM